MDNQKKRKRDDTSSGQIKKKQKSKSKSNYKLLNPKAGMGKLTRLVNKVDFIVPDEYFTKMKYVFNRTVSSTTGSVWSQVFRTNSVYDPDFTGVGQSVLGLTQLATLYGRYTVLGTRYKSRVTADASLALAMTSYTDTDSTSHSSLQDSAAEPYGQVKNGNPLYEPFEMSGYVTSGEAYGKSKQGIINDPNFSAGVANNPVNPVFLHIQGAPLDGSSNGSWYLEVTMEFYVKFWDRKKL